LLNVAVNPVGVGVSDATVKPRVVMALLMPTMVMGLDETVSVAVIVQLPPVLSVTPNVPTPPVSEESNGTLALGSLLVLCHSLIVG
jgi:hypothetical protein